MTITAEAKEILPQPSVTETIYYPLIDTPTWRSKGASSNEGSYFNHLIAEAETKTASTTPASGTIQLEGKAERTEMDLGAAENALKDYKQAYNYLSAGKFGPAAELFKRAGDQFDQGFERYRGESRYAEAQCRRMLGQKAASSSLYQAAIKIFKEHDPESPYLKAAIEQLGNIELKVQEARLDAPPRKLEGAIDIDRTVTLQGRIGEDGVRLSGRKALLEVEKKFIDDSIHQCFTEMTCLETAELGSNSTNAKNRWTPLLAYGNPTAVLASDDYFTPLIKVKINGKRYNVNIDLPGLTSHQQTVLLLTDGEKICAIDPATNDVWLLKMTFKKDGNTQFKFKKLLHQKDFKFKKPVSKQSSALDRLLNRTSP
jgi:tetratricopeptide (TPR) repeat protein